MTKFETELNEDLLVVEDTFTRNDLIGGEGVRFEENINVREIEPQGRDMENHGREDDRSFGVYPSGRVNYYPDGGKAPSNNRNNNTNWELDQPVKAVGMQQFATGATRSADNNKNDYEGYLDATVLKAYGDYMTKHRFQRDGNLRDSDNWKKGIPIHKLVKSLFRHTVDLVRAYQGTVVLDPDHDNQPMTMLDISSAIMFNVMGFMREVIRRKGEKALMVCDHTRDAIVNDRPFSFFNCGQPEVVNWNPLVRTGDDLQRDNEKAEEIRKFNEADDTYLRRIKAGR